MTTRLSAALAAVSLCTALCISPCAHVVRAQAVTREGFVTTLGRDTVVLERVARTARHTDGDILVRIPAPVRLHYEVDRDSTGRVRSTLLDIRPVNGASVAARQVRLTPFAAGDSIRVVTDSAGASHVRSVAGGALTPHLVTGFGSSYGLYTSLGLLEELLARTTLYAGDTTRVATVPLASGRAQFQELVRHDATHVALSYFGIGWTELVTDDSGHITAADASATTEQTQSRRAPADLVAHLDSTFAARDSAGATLGVASPNDTVRAVVGDVAVQLTFGSPRLRGRTILGNVVPFDALWRTGANAATVLRIDRDVTLGGHPLAKGSYSLWTIPSRSGVALVVNAQSGQWGTEHDPARDLFTIPLRVTTVVARREAFNIAIANSGDGRALQIMWDDFVWSTPIASSTRR